MKRFTLIFLALILIFTVAGCKETNTMAILANMASIEVGCTVKQSGDLEVDRSLRNLHKYSVSGEIPQDAIDQLNTQLSKVMKSRPTLPAQISNLAAMLGANVDPETNKIIGVVEVPPEVLRAVAMGYNSGFNVCSAE